MTVVPGRTAVQVSEAYTSWKASNIRKERDTKIYEVEWRVSRYRREVDLNLPHTDDLTALNTYIQALCDVPQQSGFPDSVVWPIL